METKTHTRTATVSTFGRSYCYITCPFCSAVVKAYIWSLNGSGKKCNCGALHGGWGQTIKNYKPEKENKKPGV